MGFSLPVVIVSARGTLNLSLTVPSGTDALNRAGDVALTHCQIRCVEAARCILPNRRSYRRIRPCAGMKPLIFTRLNDWITCSRLCAPIALYRSTN